MTVTISSRPKQFITAGRGILAAAALLLASPAPPAWAKDAGQQAAPIFTVIVTRHGVRAYPNPNKKKCKDRVLEEADAPKTEPAYAWADWGPDFECKGKDEDHEYDLTLHGYRLMTLMGEFYKQAQSFEKLPVDPSCKNVFVYADTDQRTLATAHALVEGMCGSPEALHVFHELDVIHKKDVDKDPIFDATKWLLGQPGRINLYASWDAVGAATGKHIWYPIKENGHDFVSFQKLLNTRCSEDGCPSSPISNARAFVDDDEEKSLAALKGPVDTARGYSENVFLEYAQCRPLSEISKLKDDAFLDALQAGMRLHVLAYDINARNTNHNVDPSKVYNPYVRGGTLLWHIVAILDQKAGRTTLSQPPSTPSELENKDKDIVIFSGHDTQLGALGGILDADWEPEGGIVPNDMPPGSALVFDLMPGADGKYLVRLRFASMTLNQFKKEVRLNDGINFTPVEYRFCKTTSKQCVCNTEGCSAPLEDFESLVLDNEKFVDFDWKMSSEHLSQDPVSSVGLKDPAWTHCND
jgi:4-phytase/acid phosphatase